MKPIIEKPLFTNGSRFSGLNGSPLYKESEPNNNFMSVISAGKSKEGLSSYAENHVAEINQLLKVSGGVLFTGFNVASAAGFGDVVRALGIEPLPYLERAAKRTEVAPGVFTSTEFSSRSWIDLHHEMSFSRDLPESICFYAETVAETGGETPVADEFLATELLSNSILEVFDEKKLLYVRNYHQDVDMSWRSAFQTESKDEVAGYCDLNNISYEWVSDEHLRTKQLQSAFVCHRPSGRKLFCNHAHIFHQSALDAELQIALVEAYGVDNLPRNVFFGDGSPIPEYIISEIRNVYKSCQRLVSWKRDDVLLLDNIRCLHGRAPFTGERTTLVSMASLISRNY